MVTNVGNEPYTTSKTQSRQDDITSEQNGSIESLNRRTKYRTTIILVLVFSCLVTLAIALTVVFVFAKPQNKKQGMENAE